MDGSIQLTPEEKAMLDLLILAKQQEAGAAGAAGVEAQFIGAIGAALARVTRVAVKYTPAVFRVTTNFVGGAAAAGQVGGAAAAGQAGGVPQDVTLQQLLELRNQVT